MFDGLISTFLIVFVLRFKQFVRGLLRDLIQDSKYSDDQLKTDSNKNGLIKASKRDFP